MDYLQQIKEEYPDVEPYSGDLEWDNQAYSHFRNKNFVQAEETFKKVCLSEPEWFMEEALKRAREFIKGVPWTLK